MFWPRRACSRSLAPLRPTRVHGIGETLVLQNGPLRIGYRPALGRQSLVDGGSPGGSTPPVGVVRLPSLPLTATRLAPDIARAGPQDRRPLSKGRYGERENQT